MKFKIFLIFLIVSNVYAQTFVRSHFGATAGVIVNIGTHINSTGIILKSYYQDYFYQINLGSNFTFNFKSYGNRKKFWESRNYLGLQLLGGKKNNTIDFYLDGLTHQSTFQNAIGYNYIWYFDNAQTSQRSGGWSLSFTNFALYFENDVFGGQAKDRFRTGHLFITYRTSTIKTGVGFYIWTGETSGTKWIHIERPKNKYGYKSLENTLYGRTSAGALYGSIIYNLPYGQNLFSKIGIDSEHLRHAIQNRFIHDLIFLPAKVQRNTPHYPRLDSKGMPVFDKDSVRKSKFYFQIGTNENWSN